MDEEHEHTPGQPHAFLWIFDVTDPKKIQALSTFNVSETESPWSQCKGRFGAHQFREKIDGTLVYVTWFSGGLRALVLVRRSSGVGVHKVTQQKIAITSTKERHIIDNRYHTEWP